MAHRPLLILALLSLTLLAISPLPASGFRLFPWRPPATPARPEPVKPPASPSVDTGYAGVLQDTNGDDDDDDTLLLPSQTLVKGLDNFRPLQRGPENLEPPRPADGSYPISLQLQPKPAKGGETGNGAGRIQVQSISGTGGSDGGKSPASANKGGDSGGSGDLADNVTFFEVARPIARPRGVKPCVVALLRNQSFGDTLDDDAPASVNFSIPASCGNAWSLVLLSVRVNVSGVQFDRVLSVFLGNFEVSRSITVEPLGVSASYSFEEDLTAYSSMLLKERQAFISLPNTVNDTLTGVFYVSIDLLFFKTSKFNRAAVPDLVLPFSTQSFSGQPPVKSYPASFTITGEDSESDPSSTSSSTDSSSSSSLKASVTFPSLPRDIVTAKVELLVTRHGGDEFFFMLSPNTTSGVTSDLLSSPPSSFSSSSPFRELLLQIDSQFAGAVLPFPSLYPSAFAPLLWAPMVGIGCLGVPTYFLDVTPFVGLLVDGQPHEISVSMPAVGRAARWMISGVLHLWVDPARAVTTGTPPLITAPEPTILASAPLPSTIPTPPNDTAAATAVPTAPSDNTTSQDSASSTLESGFTTSTLRSYTITGTVYSSAGAVTTEVTGQLGAEASVYFQNEGVIAWTHVTRVSVEVTSRDARGSELSSVTEQNLYPVNLKMTALDGNGSFKFDTDYAFNLQRDKSGKRFSRPVSETLLNQRFGSYIEYCANCSVSSSSSSDPGVATNNTGAAAPPPYNEYNSTASCNKTHEGGSRNGTVSYNSQTLQNGTRCGGSRNDTATAEEPSKAEQPQAQVQAQGGKPEEPMRALQLVEQHFAFASNDKAVGCYSRNVAIAGLEVVANEVSTDCLDL